MVAYKYIVDCLQNSDVYNEFDDEKEAIAYAKQYEGCNAFVDKVEVELNDFGEVTYIGEKERIWPSGEMSQEESDEWLAAMEKQHEDELYADPFDADEFGDYVVNRFEGLDADKMVEDLEENEDEVECKKCFGLFPKEECAKIGHGYVCKECAKQVAAESLKEEQEAGNKFLSEQQIKYFENWLKEGVNEAKMEYTDERYNEVQYSLDYSSRTQEFCFTYWYYRSSEDNNGEVGPDGHLTDEDSICGKTLMEVIEKADEYLDEIKKLYDEYEADILDFNEVVDEDLEEHIQDRPAPVESEQELKGADNAVVDCPVADVIAHSEDEKPLDCKMEKKPLAEDIKKARVADVEYNDDDGYDCHVLVFAGDLTEDELVDELYDSGMMYVYVNEIFEKEVNGDYQVGDVIEVLDEGLTEAKKDEADDKEEDNEDEIPDDFAGMMDYLNADEEEAIDGYKKVIDKVDDEHVATELEKIETEEKAHKDFLDAVKEDPTAEYVEPLEQEEKPEEQEGQEESLQEMTPPPFDSDAKVGDRIRIIHLAEEDNSYDGKEGVVEHIDSLGQLHGTWGGLAVIPGVDEFEIIGHEDIEEKPADLDDELDEAVLCSWCGNEYSKKQCKHEHDLGWLCPDCEKAKIDNGEKLLFTEDLEEDLDEEESKLLEGFLNDLLADAAAGATVGAAAGSLTANPLGAAIGGAVGGVGGAAFATAKAVARKFKSLVKKFKNKSAIKKAFKKDPELKEIIEKLIEETGEDNAEKILKWIEDYYENKVFTADDVATADEKADEAGKTLVRKLAPVAESAINEYFMDDSDPANLTDIDTCYLVSYKGKPLCTFGFDSRFVTWHHQEPKDMFDGIVDSKVIEQVPELGIFDKAKWDHNAEVLNDFEFKELDEFPDEDSEFGELPYFEY